MIAPAQNAPASAIESSPAEQHIDPPCLRRRAPARLDLSLRSGRCPDMGGRRVHVRAGRTLIVQVLPQSASAHVDITAEEPLRMIVPVSRVESGPVPSYHAEYVGRSLFRVIPLPTTGKLHISLADGFPNPLRVTIPVTVWPSLLTMMLWWLLASLSIVGVRWQSMVAHSRSPWDVFPQVWSDVPFLLGLLALGVVVVVLLRVVGSVATLVNVND